MLATSDIKNKLKLVLGGTFNIVSGAYVLNYIMQSENQRTQNLNEVNNSIINELKKVQPLSAYNQLATEAKKVQSTTAHNSLTHEYNSVQMSSSKDQLTKEIETNPNKPHDNQLNSNSHTHILRNMFNGIVAGASVAITTFPLEARKKRNQSGHTGEFHWFRGANVFAANIIPTTTIHFGTDRFLKDFLPVQATIAQNMAASIICGVTGALTATFVENTVVRQQVLKKGPLHVITDMFNVSYLRPWKTFPYIATRDGIFTFSMFWAIPTASNWCKQNAPQYELVTPFAISLAGAALSHPADTIATRLQMHHLKESGLKAAKSLINEAGVKGLYKGFSHRFGLFTIFSNGLPYVNKFVDQTISPYIFGDKNNTPKPR